MINVLIIGAGEAGKMVLKEMRNHGGLYNKFEVIGFLDDDTQKKKIDGIPVLGKIDTAQDIVKKYDVAEIIIAIPSAGQNLISRIISALSEAKAKIKIVPGIFEIIEGSVSFSQIRDIAPTDLLGREEVSFDLDLVAPFYKDKTIFVTGAGGSIGSEIFNQILKLPVKQCIAFGRGENSIHKLINKYNSDKRFEYVIGDIKDFEKIHHEIDRFKPDIIFHAAAHKHVPLMENYPDEAVKNNIFGTLNVAKGAIENEVGQFLLVSTDKAVNPVSVMGMSKRVAERIIISFNKIQDTTKFRLVRFGNVLGSRGSVVPIFERQIRNGGPVTVTHPEITRYFMSIPEAAKLVIKSVLIENGKIFILDMGKPIRIQDLAKNLIRLHGYIEEEIPIKFTGLRPGEKMYEELLTDTENLAKSKFEKLYVSDCEEIAFDEKELNTMIGELEKVIQSYDTELIKQKLMEYR